MSLKYMLYLTASLALALPMPASAQTVAASGPAAKTDAAKSSPDAPVTHAEFESLLRDTLLNNPQIIMDTVKKLHDQHMAEADKQMKEALDKHKDELMNDTQSPSVGSRKHADVTIVEFFDYHCGYCKHMLPVVTETLHNDKKVRFIFREFPILAEDSVTASRAAIAVYKIDPEKYFDFYSALMESNGKFDETSLADAARKVGVNVRKMKKEMEDPDISKMLDNNRAIAEDIGIRGTPAFIIDGQLLPGAVSYDEMAKIIADARKGKTAKLDVKPKASAEPVPPKE